MRLDQDPERSPSPVSELSDNEDVDDEADLLESIAEKEAELNRTQAVITEQNRHMETALAELHRINDLLKQFETLTHNDLHFKD